MISCGFGKIMNAPEDVDIFYEINALIKHCIIGNYIHKTEFQEFSFKSEEDEDKCRDWLEDETEYVANELTRYIKEKYDIKVKNRTGEATPFEEGKDD
jgi:hypothetical protein